MVSHSYRSHTETRVPNLHRFKTMLALFRLERSGHPIRVLDAPRISRRKILGYCAGSNPGQGTPYICAGTTCGFAPAADHRWQV